MVAACEFGNEEDTRQWGMHDACHEARHTCQRKIGFGYADAEHVHESGADKSNDGSHEERRRKNTTYTATTVGGYGCKNLEQDNGGEIAHQYPRTSAKAFEGTIGNGRNGVAVDELLDDIITLAVEWREEEKQQAQCRATYKELNPNVLDMAFEELLQTVHAAREVE